MPLVIPTTKELFDQFLALFESRLNQTIPLADKAFLRVLAIAQSIGFTTLYKFGAERARQTLALTATGSDLDVVGNEYKVTRKPAESAELLIELPATTGTTIPINVDFVGDSNNERYIPRESVVAESDVATIEVIARNPGINGNLNVDDTLTIGRQIPGILDTTATVIEVLNIGVDRETDDAYRRRILNEIRTVGGGGNSADYRTWAEEVGGVYAAYPYSGKPVGEGTSLPGDRTVYVEATTDIDPDGIAPSALLDEVEDSINYDPITGIARPPLGEIEDTLFVRSIYRTGFYVEVRDLTVDSSLEFLAKNAISNALEQYLRSVRPFIDGLDFAGDRNDTITTLTVSQVVQTAIARYGGLAAGVGFSLIPGSFEFIYQLGKGELAKLLGVSYV